MANYRPHLSHSFGQICNFHDPILVTIYVPYTERRTLYFPPAVQTFTESVRPHSSIENATTDAESMPWNPESNTVLDPLTLTL